MAFAQEEKLLEEEELRFIVFWEGTDPIMHFSELAAYCAPIFWYSPDEPELKRKEGKEIRIPAAFPFEQQVDAPVVYYQIRKILIREELQEDALSIYTSEIDSSTVDLSKVAGFDIDVKKIKKTGEIPVKPIEDLDEYIKENNISVAIMAVPDIAAQQTLEILKRANIKGILNFTPVKFKSTEEMTINNFNIENELVNLIYFVNKYKKNGQEVNQ